MKRRTAGGGNEDRDERETERTSYSRGVGRPAERKEDVKAGSEDGPTLEHMVPLEAQKEEDEQR